MMTGIPKPLGSYLDTFAYFPFRNGQLIAWFFIQIFHPFLRNVARPRFLMISHSNLARFQ